MAVTHTTRPGTMPFEEQPQRPPPSFQSGSDRPPRSSRPPSRAIDQAPRDSFTGVGSVYYGRPGDRRTQGSAISPISPPPVVGVPAGAEYQYPPAPSPNPRASRVSYQHQSYFAQQQEAGMQQQGLQSPNLAAPTTPDMQGDQWGRSGSPGALPALHLSAP